MRPADVTLQQLGGRGRLKTMIGAKDFFSDKDGLALSFKFKMCKKANCIRITLNALDTYDVEFGKIWRLNYKTVAEFSNIYADQLRDVIEDFTGLHLSMGTMTA